MKSSEKVLSGQEKGRVGVGILQQLQLRWQNQIFQRNSNMKSKLSLYIAANMWGNSIQQLWTTTRKMRTIMAMIKVIECLEIV